MNSRIVENLVIQTNLSKGVDPSLCVIEVSL